MALWSYFHTLFFVVLLILPKMYVFTFEKPDNILEEKHKEIGSIKVKRMLNNSIRSQLLFAKMSNESPPPFVLQRKPRHSYNHSNRIADEYNRVTQNRKVQNQNYENTSQQTEPSIGVKGPILQNVSITPLPTLLSYSENQLLFDEVGHSEKDRAALIRLGNINKSDKPHRQNVHSSDQKQTRNKLKKIQEKSETLIKRLCAVGASKKHICYKSGSSSCYCTGGLGDCSGKRYVTNIAYAPKLPREIKCLKFVYNIVEHLDESYFSNVSTFIVIDFSSNKLITISPKTFQRFTNLQYLILNYNSFGYLYLRAVLDYPPRLRLDIIGLGLENATEGYFDKYSTIPTAEIYMDNNYINSLDIRVFSPLKNLEYLSLSGCSINQVISAHMPRLKVLDLDYNNISIFPATCNINAIKNSFYNYLDIPNITDNKWSIYTTVSNKLKKVNAENDNISLYPSLTDLYIGYNIVQTLPERDEVCLLRLKTLHLESNNITTIPESAFTALISLKVLMLDKMSSGITKIGRSAFNISTLTSLYMSKNRIAFDSSSISAKLFEGCSKLEILSIDHNKLGGVSEDMFEKLFEHTPALKSIYLSSTNMYFIPTKAFSQLRNIERLYIYVNEIKEIPPGAFDDMISLHYLYMDENQISTVKESAFSLKTRHRLKMINLSKNKYLCDCNLLWFQSWLLEAGPSTFMEFENYICSNINNMSVQNYVISRQACFFSRQTYILFVICLSVTMIMFIVFVILYRYRWNIRLFMYERRAPLRNSLHLSGEKHFRYDVFVIYCKDDSEWIIELLIPMLEINWGLKACIHQRDFVAGSLIMDNIVESMNDSKRILVVISSRFALSRWCNFELHLCQSHVITHDLPSLLVIILDKVQSRDMSAALLALYKTTCFLEWPTCSSDAQGIDIFWGRLERSLVTVIGNITHETSAKRVG